MKSLLLKFAIVALAVTAYIGSPFVTAWSIREATRNGDTDYLARAIDWPSIRQTLKPSLNRIALDLPDGDRAPQQNPGLWQRFKAYWGQGAVNSAVDNYLTPESLPKLYAMRKGYRNFVSGEEDEAKKFPLTERIRRFWSRVKRAEFTSFTTVEIDLLDKHNPNRMYLSTLELTERGWILRGLRIKDLETAKNADPQPLVGPTKSAWRAGAPAAAQKAPLLSIGWSLNLVSPAEAAPAKRQDPESGFWQRAVAAAR